MTCRARGKSPCEPLGLGRAAAGSGSIGKERCSTQTCSLLPSCWLSPSPGAAQGPESPKTSVGLGQEQALLFAPCSSQPRVPAIGRTGVSVCLCPAHIVCHASSSV